MSSFVEQVTVQAYRKCNVIFPREIFVWEFFPIDSHPCSSEFLIMFTIKNVGNNIGYHLIVELIWI